ncbi:MAG: hypothetical protein ACLSFZ_13060 [Frisingicoccus sp.]
MKNIGGCLIIAAVLYLLVGAMAPFAIYRKYRNTQKRWSAPNNFKIQLRETGP